MAHAIWRYKINKAHSLNASDAVNTIYFYDLEVISIGNWRVVTTKPTNNSDQKSHQQKQYHVYFAPMTIENWALPIFKKAGFTPKKVHPIAHSAVECACCEICFYNVGLQPETNVPPFDDMYICEVCNRTHHSVCLKNTGCYTERQREEVDKNGDWACPGCAHLNDEQKQKRYSESINKELIHVSWEPTWEPEELKDTLPDLLILDCTQDFETRVDEPDLFLHTQDQTLDKLERQGFDMSNKANPWIQKLDTDLQNKVTFDVHPTNPQVDIQPTGSCEFWIRNVDLVSYKPRPTIEQPSQNTNLPPLILPEICSSRVACIYSTDIKCQGMMTLERLNILHAAIHTAKLKCVHNNIKPAPKSFASELLGLLIRKTKLERKYHSKRIKVSYSRTLPNHIHAALQEWALITQEKMASPLDFNPGYPHYWSADSRDALFGAHLDSLSSQFTGFSVCHPSTTSKL